MHLPGSALFRFISTRMCNVRLILPNKQRTLIQRIMHWHWHELMHFFWGAVETKFFLCLND